MSGTVPRGEVTVEFPDMEFSDADVGLAPAEFSDADVGLAPPATPRPETAGEAALRAPGRAARMGLQGVLSVPDMLNNAGAAVLNAPFVAWDMARGNAPGTSEPFRYGAIAGAGRRVADEAGLPQYPNTPEGRVIGMIGEGMAGGAGVAPLARQAARVTTGAAQQVARAFGDAPGVDMFAGGVGGGAQGVAAEAGVGEGGQVAANLGGNFGAALAAAIIAAVARRRAAAPPESIRPNPDAVTPEEFTEALADPDVRRLAEANGITDPADPRIAQIQERLTAARTAETARAEVAPSVTETDLRAGREAVESGVNPAFVEPPPRQPVPETIALPQDPSGPPLRGTPDPNAIGIEPAVERFGRAGDPAIAYDARRAELERAQVEADSAAVRAQQAEDARLQQLGFDTNRARIQAEIAARPEEAPRAPVLPPESAPPASAGPGGASGAAAPRVVQPAAPAARPGGGAPSDGRAVEGGVSDAPQPGVPARVQQQIDRLTRNGEPAPGSRAAAQLARLRAQATPATGEASARPAPQPDGPARPPEAATTPRQAAADMAPEVAPVARDTAAPRPAVTEPPAASTPARTPQEQPPAGGARRAEDSSTSAAPAPGRSAPTPGQSAKPRADLPDVGETVYLRPAGTKKRAAAYTIREYRRIPGTDEWVFKADGPNGVGLTDGIDTLRGGEGRAANAPTGREAPPLASGLPITPANVKRFLTDPAMAAARSVRDALMGSTALRTVGRTLADAGRGIERTFRVIAHSKRAGMDWLARRYENIPEVRQMRDMLATAPGENRTIGQTYQTAIETRHASMANRLQAIVGKDAGDAEWSALRDQLIGKKGATDTSRRVRKLLDEQHDYLKAAGVDLGYVRGRFFPRRYDTDKILADPESFLRDAETFYRRRMGMDADTAAEAAGDWLARVSGVGPSFAHTPMSAKHTKGRTLPPEADTDLARWLDTDPRTALDGYLRATTRQAEFTRRFGPNGKLADEMFRAMLDKGMAPHDVALMRRFFEGSTGTLHSSAPGPMTAAADWIQTAGSAALLSKAVLSSLVEGFAVASRSGNLLRGLEAFADSWKLVFNSDSLPDARRAAELIGTVHSSLSDGAAATSVGVQDIQGKLPQRITNSVFRRTGLSGLTERQQIAATRAGQTWISSLLDDVMDGTRRQESAKRLLAELGLDEKDARAVGAWLRKNDGTPTTEMLIDGGREGALYRTAISRFVRESVQNAQMVDKPLYAEHPVGRLAYGITSFMFAFSRNVLLRSMKQGGEAMTAKGLTLEDRVRLMGPVFGLMTLAAAQFGVGWVRDNLLNPQQAAERDTTTKVILALDRTGMFGTASPLVNQVTSAKYQRHPATVLTGPYLSFYLDAIQKMSTALTPQPVGPNSPRTNNAEHTAARAAYRAIIAPAITMGLATLPGSPAVAAAYGIGMVAAGMPAAAWEFADATVGERTVKPRGAGGGTASSGGIRAGGGIAPR